MQHDRRRSTPVSCMKARVCCGVREVVADVELVPAGGRAATRSEPTTMPGTLPPSSFAERDRLPELLARVRLHALRAARR